MIRALILVHRWLGIAFCLLFAMWFATGIVMHFVAFPALTEAERFDGLAPLDLAAVTRTPAEAVSASGLPDVTRVRLLQRSDGPIYLLSGAAGHRALRASDLASAAMSSASLAVSIAADHAQRRGLDPSRARMADVARYDQWSVPITFDGDRPLYRIALDDAAGTEFYVSSSSGLVVLDTTRRERAWNYAGSVAHWIYPTLLRSNPAAWNATVWWLSLIAMIAAITGAALGIVRIEVKRRLPSTPYRGLQAWHHILGLVSMMFVLTWIVSGWLSMDHGLLFSNGRFSADDARAVTGTPAWNSLPADPWHPIGTSAIEAEWFAIDGRIDRRVRTGPGRQTLAFDIGGVDSSESPSGYLQPGDLSAVAARLGRNCTGATAIAADDDYAVASVMPGAPVYRLVCGDTWFHIDGANGALLEKLDRSRRAYRWLYAALHTFDVPVLMARPMLRTVLIVALCGLGFVFSLTGIVIGWRRLTSVVTGPACCRPAACGRRARCR